MDIRRTILWVIFTFSLLLLWNNWQTYNGQPSLFAGFTPTSEKTKVDEAKTVARPDSVPANIPATTTTSDSTVPTANAAGTNTAPAPIAQKAPEPASEKFTITTDVYKLVFDSTGAQIVHAELLKYESDEDASKPMVLLEDKPGSIYLAQSGVIGAQGSSYPNHLTPFKLISSAHTSSGGTLDVVFEAQSDGVKLIKTYTLHPGSYDIHVRHDLYNLSDEPISPSLYLQLTRDGNDPPNTSFFYSSYTGPAVYSSEEKFQKIKFSDIDKNKASYIKETKDGWIAMIQHYFATAWIPVEDKIRHNEVLRVADNLYSIRSIQPVGTIQPNSHQAVESQLWLGPQDQRAMQAVAPGLDVVVDYGFLTIVAKPVFQLMTWLHGFVGNWGWTIVILTLLIKLLFYPLSAASYRSMAKMKLVAPRLKALREKFGDDRAKMNAAMMEMYRTEKINPLGGCLPMVIQIPVFIALYWVLRSSVEMRGAPWIGWIHDLAAPDHWFILPAVMMATMFLQIKLNPTPPDPMQARIMMLMPLVFGATMFFFPAGLVLYWCVNNIVSIAQQRYIMYKLDVETKAVKR